MISHRYGLACDPRVLVSDGGILVGLSANIVGNASTLVGAVDCGKCCCRVEKLRDAGARTRRPGGHRASPARQHDRIEIAGAELVAEKQGAIGPEIMKLIHRDL